MDKLFKPRIHELEATPCPQKFQRYGFVSLFLILGFDLFRPFEGANQAKKNIVIGGAGGYWITRVWIIRPSTVRGPVVSRSAENVIFS